MLKKIKDSIGWFANSRNPQTFFLDYLGFLGKGKTEKLLFNDGSELLFKTGTRDSLIAGEIYVEKCYIDNYTPKDGDTVVDFGCNKGFYSAWVANFANQKGIHVNLYSFEPFVENYDFARRNIEMNNKQGHCRSELYLEGIASNTRKEQLFISDLNEGSHSIIQNDTSTQKAVEISLRGINDFMDPLERVDFMKMDIEGSEFEVFEAISDQNLAKCRMINLEYHEDIGKEKNFKLESIVKKLEGNNFTTAHDKSQLLIATKK